jgi:hypothetical protein
MTAGANPKMLTAFDAAADAVAGVALADLAADIRRDEILGPGDPPGTGGGGDPS